MEVSTAKPGGNASQKSDENRVERAPPKKSWNRSRKKIEDDPTTGKSLPQTQGEAVAAYDTSSSTSKKFNIMSIVNPNRHDWGNSTWLDDANPSSHLGTEQVPRPKAGRKRLNQGARRKLAAEMNIPLDTRLFRQIPTSRKESMGPMKGARANKEENPLGSLQTEYQLLSKVSDGHRPPKSHITSLERSLKATRISQSPLDTYSIGPGSQQWVSNVNKVAASRTPDIPLRMFTLFPLLAAELRFKIWYWVCHTDRLIELSWYEGDPSGSRTRQDSSDDDDETIFEMHQRIQVCRQSRKPPAALQVSRESRTEALKYYTLANFDSHSFNLPTSIYFNPISDIVFFGEHTCISTIIHLFRQPQKISRVAIISSNKIYRCCDWDTDGSPYCDNYGGFIPGGCTAVQALHGISPELATNDGFPGAKGLREVFWIVPTSYKAFAAGEVNAGTILRKATTNGITNSQRMCKAQIIDSMKEVDDEGLKLVGPNNWSGINKPVFRFRTLAPQGAGDRHHDAILLDCRRSRNLGITATHSGPLVRELETKTGCEITVCGRVAPRERDMELGLYGTATEIEAAKSGLNAKITALEDVHCDFQRGHWDRKKGKGRWRAPK